MDSLPSLGHNRSKVQDRTFLYVKIVKSKRGNAVKGDGGGGLTNSNGPLKDITRISRDERNKPCNRNY